MVYGQKGPSTGRTGTSLFSRIRLNFNLSGPKFSIKSKVIDIHTKTDFLN